MKILFVQKEGGIFGAENYQLKIIPALIRKGYTIEFLRLYTNYQGGKGGRFVDLLRSYGVPVYEINIGRFLRPWNLFKIYRLIKKGRYALVHTHLIHADFHLALIKKFFFPSLKLVSTKHGYDNAYTARYGFDPTKQTRTPYFLLSRFSERTVTKSFTVTHALHRFFIQTKLTDAKKMAVIHYGFDFESPDASWQSHHYRLYKKQLIIAGRLVRFKGHRYVLEAMPAVIRKFPDAGLVIVGIGEMEKELKELTEQLKLTAHVTFLQYSSEVQRWMYNSEIVLVPSISEGFGVVLLEAFNCAKPVVAFNVPACNEIIEHEKTGYLVEPFNIEQLSERVTRLLTNSDNRTIGEAAQRRLKSYFNLERMVDQTTEFYKTV